MPSLIFSAKVTGLQDVERFAKATGEVSKGLDNVVSATGKSVPGLENLASSLKRISSDASTVVKGINNINAALSGLRGFQGVLDKAWVGGRFNSDIAELSKQTNTLNTNLKGSVRDMTNFVTASGKYAVIAKENAAASYEFNAALRAQIGIKAQIQSADNAYVAALAKEKALNNEAILSLNAKTAAINAQVAAYERLVAAGKVGAGTYVKGTNYTGQEKVERGRTSLKQGDYVAQMKAEEKLYDSVSGRIKSQIPLINNLGKAWDYTTEKSRVFHSALRGVSGSLGNLWLTYANGAHTMAVMGASFAAVSATMKTVNMGAEFDYMARSIAKLSNLQASIQTIDAIKGAILSLNNLPFNANELAEGVLEFARAGYSAVDVIKDMGEVSNFAYIGGMNLGEAVQFAVGQLSAFKGQNIGDTLNAIAIVADKTSIDLKQMAEALKNTTSLGTVMGLKFNDIAEAIGIMGQSGIRGATAGAALSTMMYKLINPTASAEKAMKQLGVSFKAIDENGQVKSVADSIKELSAATAQLSPGQRADLFEQMVGLRGIKALGGLIDMLEKTPEKIKEIRDALAEIGGDDSYLKNFEKILDESGKVQISKLKAEFDNLFIANYDNSSVVNAVKALRDIVGSSDMKAAIAGTSSALIGMVEEVARFYTKHTELFEYGLIGLLVYGKKGAAIGASIGYLDELIKKFEDAVGEGENFQYMQERGLAGTGKGVQEVTKATEQYIELIKKLNPEVKELGRLDPNSLKEMGELEERIATITQTITDSKKTKLQLIEAEQQKALQEYEESMGRLKVKYEEAGMSVEGFKEKVDKGKESLRQMFGLKMAEALQSELSKMENAWQVYAYNVIAMNDQIARAAIAAASAGTPGEQLYAAAVSQMISKGKYEQMKPGDQLKLQEQSKQASLLALYRQENKFAQPYISEQGEIDHQKLMQASEDERKAILENAEITKYAAAQSVQHAKDTLALSLAKKSNTAATKIERAELKDLSAQVKLLAFEQEKATNRAKEFTVYAVDAYKDLEKYYDQYATVNMSGPEKEMYEQVKAFSDVSEAINKYQISLTNAQAEYDKLILKQEQTFQEIWRIKNELATNGVSGSDAERDARVVKLNKEMEDADVAARALSNTIFEINKRQAMHKQLMVDIAEKYRDKSVWDSMLQGMKEVQYTGTEMARDIENATVRAFDNMTDALVDFIQTGKFNFRDFADSVIADILRIMVKAAIVGPIATYLSSGTWDMSNTSAAAKAAGVGGMDLTKLMGGSGYISSGLSSWLSGPSVDPYFGGSNESASGLFSGVGSWMQSNPALSSGIMGGALSSGMSLLSGKGLTAQTGLQAAGTGIGAALGFGAPGAIIGGLLGNIAGGILGDNGPDTFHFLSASDAYGGNYLRGKGMDIRDYEFTGSDDDSKIFKAYGDQIRSIQKAYNSTVENLAAALPAEIANSMTAGLEAADLRKLLIDASQGKFETAKAEEAIKQVAERYSKDLMQSLGDVYANAVTSYVQTNGISKLVGNEAVWNKLTIATRDNITSTFTNAISTIRDGKAEEGIKTIQDIMTSISKIGEAMAPITEMLETADLTDYELNLRSINKQFDEYAEALRAAGVDLALYTDLEKARRSALSKLAKEDLGEWASGNLDKAEDALRRAFNAARDALTEAANAQKELVTKEHELKLEDLNKQLDKTQEYIGNIEGLVSDLGSTIEGMRLETEAFIRGRRQEAQVRLQTALVSARGGDFGPASDMGNTLDVLSEPSADLFSSFTDYQRDYWVTVNSMKELQKLGEVELASAKTSEQLLQQLIDEENGRFDDMLESMDKQLEAELKAYDSQLNALLGIQDAILSIAQASSNYASAQAIAKAAGVSGKGGAGNTAKIDAYSSYFNQKFSQLADVGLIGTTYDGVKLDSVADVVEVFAKQGYTPQSHWEQFGKYEGLDRPSFAKGTDYVPYNMTADIHKGERIVPAEYNRSDATNAELLSEIRALRVDLQESGSESAKWTQKTYKIIDEWNGGGMPEVRS